MANILMRRSLLSAACVVLLSQSGQTSAMGLMQAYDAALQNDPVYRSAVSENQAGQQYQVIGRSGLLPSVQYNYATSKNKADTTAPNIFGTPATTHPEYTSISNSISLHQTLFNLDAAARYKQGIARTNYSDAQFTSRSQDLMIRLVTAYADAKYAEDQLALYTAQRDTFAEQKRMNDRMFEKGEGTKTDMLETQAKLDVAEAQVIESADNLTTARNTLAAMIGSDVTQLDGLVNDFRVMPLSLAGFDEWQAMAGNNNSELAAARFAVEAAEQEISKSRAGHAPRLDLNASYSRSSADSITNFQQDSTVRSIGVQLVVPLYSGGYVNAVTSQAVANRDKAKSDLDASTSKVMIELRKQFSAVQSSVAKMAALQKSVNSATLLVLATQQSVKGGVRINLDVLNAQQQLVVAKRDLTQARYNYLISFLKLRVAAGTLNIDDLRAVGRYFSAEN
jgi:protease secretion system outer membrane protein